MNQALAIWVILSLIWGSTWIFIKLGLRDLPPVTFAGIRFLVAAVLLWTYIFARRRPLPRKLQDWGMIALTSLAFTINYGLLFWGENRISSGLTAVLQATIPGFGLLLAHFFLPAEPITPAKLAGVLVGIIGVAIIFSSQMNLAGRAAVVGCVGIVIGSFCAACSNILVKARCSHIDPATLAASQMTLGVIPLLGYGAWREANPWQLHWTPLAIGSLIYLSTIGSAVGFLLYYWLLQRIEVTRTLMISLVTPIIAVLIGIIAQNEPMTWRIALGSLAILLGTGLIILPRARPRLSA